MATKRNPLNLNPLQLKTVTLLQALAQLPDYAKPSSEGGIEIGRLPHAHGDHFHLGPHIVAAADCSGLNNPAVWRVLERKGLVAGATGAICRMTPSGLAYETGLRSAILKEAHHP